MCLVERALKLALEESKKKGFNIYEECYEFYNVLIAAGVIEDNSICGDRYYDPEVVDFALKCIHLINRREDK